MKKLLVVYHSMTGGALQMAQAFARGAATEPALQCVLLHASQATSDHLLNADGYLFATPENLGTMSGMLKDFFDRTYYAVLDQLNGRPYASMICAGSDGQGAARQLERFATGWRLRPIAAPLIIVTGAQTVQAILQPKLINPDDLQRCEELGSAFAAGLGLAIF